jgi:ankyrin repeat protein
MKRAGGPTPLNEALWKQDRAAIAKLLPKADPNRADRWGRTPLAMAARYGTVDDVRALLARGADVDGGRTLLTPLALAAERGAADVIAVLRKAGAKATPIAAIHLGDVKALAKIDPSLADEDGVPLILHAAQSPHVEIARALLDRGASIAATDRFGETVLHRVADRRRGDPSTKAMVAFLVERGADVQATNFDRVTPLHQAVRARNLDATEALLAHGADPNAADRRGATPLHRAVTSTGAGGTAGIDAAPFVALLIAKSADPDREDARGRTPRSADRRGLVPAR